MCVKNSTVTSLLLNSESYKFSKDWDGNGLQLSTGYINIVYIYILVGKTISESLVENDSLCYLSSDSLADSYQKERELSVHHRGKKYVSQTFPSSLLSPKLEIPLPKMKRIKLLSLSPHKHKLFWHLINRQCGIVLKARQVCLPQWWWIPLFCMESLLAFLSYVVTHLSPEREKGLKDGQK